MTWGTEHLLGVRAVRFLYLASNELKELERGALPSSLQFMYNFVHAGLRAVVLVFAN